MRVPLLAILVISSQTAVAAPDLDFNKFQLNKGELISELRSLKSEFAADPMHGKVIDSLVFYTDTHYKGGSNLSF